MAFKRSGVRLPLAPPNYSELFIIFRTIGSACWVWLRCVREYCEELSGDVAIRHLRTRDTDKNLTDPVDVPLRMDRSWHVRFVAEIADTPQGSAAEMHQHSLEQSPSLTRLLTTAPCIQPLASPYLLYPLSNPVRCYGGPAYERPV